MIQEMINFAVRPSDVVTAHRLTADKRSRLIREDFIVAVSTSGRVFGLRILI